MITKKKQLFVGILSFPALMLIGYLMLCAVYCIPTDRIGMHVRESAKMFDSNTSYKELSAGDLTTKQDYFTDLLMMLTAAYDGAETPFDKAINNYRVEKEGAGFIDSCAKCNKIPAKKQVKNAYMRYWHGYLIPVKIIFYFLNINEFRTLNMVIVLSLLIIISLLLYKRGKSAYIFPMLLAYCIINPLSVSVSLQYSCVYYITSLALIVMLLFWDSAKYQQWIWYYFMLIGIVTSYMDLLTYPIVTLGFPLILYFALSNLLTFRQALKRLVGYSISWGVGYAVFWGLKWVLSSIIMRSNLFTSVISHVKFRSGNVVSDVSVSLRAVLERHLPVITANSSIKYAIVLCVVLSVIALFYTGLQKTHITSCIMILLIATYPFLWYKGTINHSYIHFFTYRDLSISVLSITTFLLPLLNRKKRGFFTSV